MRIEDIQSVPLPTELIHAIENPLPFVREGAVRQLEGILNGQSIGLARSAREALERIAEEDDSRIVSRAALKALETIRQIEPPKLQKADEERKTREGEESKRLAMQKADAQRFVHERAEEAERKARQIAIQKNEQDHLAYEKAGEEPATLETKPATWLSSRQARITLGWAIGGAISGIIYNSSDWVLNGTIAGIYYSLDGMFAGAIGGAIGGFITALALEKEKSDFNWKSLFWMSLAWAIGGAVGWVIGESNYEVRGMAIAFGIGSMISMAIILSMGFVALDWKSLAWIVLAWAIGGAVGWSGSWALKDGLSINPAVSFATGMGMGWGIAGFVLGWQLLNNKGWTKS